MLQGRIGLRGLLVLRACIAFSWVFVMAGSLLGAAEKEYPNRPISVIIAYPPGGSIDLPIRIAQTSLRETLGVPLVLENKVGAGGALGTDFVAKAKPDGYTILAVATAGLTIAPQTNPGVTYQYTDFIPICSPTVDYITLAARPDVPFKTIDELISYAKKNPGKLNCATAGMGSAAHFFLESFKQAFGVDIVAVHFSGAVPATNAILGGHVELTAQTLGAMIPQIKAGKINLLVTGAAKRLKEFPNVPTLAEKGLTKILNVRNAVYVTQKCPKMAVDKLSEALEKAFSNPGIIEKVEKADLHVDYMKSEEAQKYMDLEFALVADIIKKGGIPKEMK